MEIPSDVVFIMASMFLRVTEGVGTAMYSTSAQLTSDFSTDFVFIVQGIRNFLPLWGHVISSAPLHRGIM